MKDEEFGEIPQETQRWFAEAGQEKVLPHFPTPPRPFALCNWARGLGIDGGCPEFEVSRTFATSSSEFSESWHRRRNGLALQQGLILTREHLIPNA